MSAKAEKEIQMAGERQLEAQKELCLICKWEVDINPCTYSPPVTDQPIMDTGFWRGTEYGLDGGGYICVVCAPTLKWSENDRKTLEYDWGIVAPLTIYNEI